MLTAFDVPYERLYNQRIAQKTDDLPGRAVAWLGAMQAQDYASVKWAVGLRCTDATDSIIEQAFADKTIVRTWLMRGTLHVAAASDVRWMLALLAPRLIANSARRHRQLGLDAPTFARSHEIFTRALQGGGQLTRGEMMLALEGGGISTDGQRGYHILGRAAQEGLICFGPAQDKQQTFVLLDEWVPRGKPMERDQALAELASRYFEGHGPATLGDFVWWSGLTVADARAGLELARPRLCQETIDDQAYWLVQSTSMVKDPSPTAYLLPAFDEYFLGYKDRSLILDPKYDKQAVSSNGVFRPMIVIDGQVVGTWKRAIKKGLVIITPSPFSSLTKAENQALAAAANHYAAFLGLSVDLI
jgi:hypothetical protein